jgi:hypothetical protein
MVHQTDRVSPDVGSPAENSLLTGFTLYDCAPLQGECIALFAAAANENSVKSIDGFVGAVCLASDCGRYALEFVLWTSRSAYIAAMAYADVFAYRQIVEHHSRLCYQEVSSISNAVADDVKRFNRGEHYCVRMDKCQPSKTPFQVNVDQWPADIAHENALVQVAERGTSLVCLSREATISLDGHALGVEITAPFIQTTFVVVDYVVAPNTQDKFTPPYHLALLPEQAS